MNYLAAWGYGPGSLAGDKTALQNSCHGFPECSRAGCRSAGSTVTFSQGHRRCVIAWENEAFLTLKEQGGSSFEIVVPSQHPGRTHGRRCGSCREEEENRGDREGISRVPLPEEGQEIIAKNYFVRAYSRWQRAMRTGFEGRTADRGPGFWRMGSAQRSTSPKAARSTARCPGQPEVNSG